jgi:hypothetical protein
VSGFSNAVVGGAETLIRSAIKSFNYVAGLTGWRISRDGNMDMNGGTFRGDVVVGNGTVKLNAGGIHVQKVVGATSQWDINYVAGFLSRHVPDNGSQAQIFNEDFLSTPQNPTPLGYTIFAPARFGSFLDNPGVADQPYTYLIAPVVTGTTQSSIFLWSQTPTGSADDSHMLVTTAIARFTGLVYVNGTDIGRGRVCQGVLGSNVVGIGNAETLVLDGGVYTFSAGRAYKVMVTGDISISASAPNRPLFHTRQSSNGVVITGTNIRATGIPVTIAAVQSNADFNSIFTVGAADVTTHIITTATSGSAAYTVTVFAGHRIEVFDIGDATMYPGASVIV